MEELGKQLFKHLGNETTDRFFLRCLNERTGRKPAGAERNAIGYLFAELYEKRILRKHFAKKAFNWLKWMDSFPETIELFSKVQLREYTTFSRFSK